jgi:hypothetical protein
MQSETQGASVLALGMAVVAVAAAIWPPLPAGRDIWIVTASEKISSRPQLVRAALPLPAKQVRMAGAL